uniref:Ig-like domain-containing protein n=1 Tax=Lates calcarifer TaxID=8187 RepID=A0A4W6D757_LATCA
AGGSVTLTCSVNPSPDKPVLTVSPSWLSPGASVTLNCEVEHPSAGWRFYWYKTVPDLSHNSYIYELLPGNSSGTEQDSYIVHGQTHTAGYVCRAGRGDPVFYTDNSEPKFVWSGDLHPAASLTVNPDRVQHFYSDSVSLSCEGNSAEWRVKRFNEHGYQSDCSDWRRMTGSTCNMRLYWYGNAVYWCESGSGEFSNAVNITVQSDYYYDIILVSPVHPVTEGESVSLGCRFRTEEKLSSVFFYHNDKLIQNDTRQELNISAVSKSDEGFYKCQWSGRKSAQSWMSVKVLCCPRSAFKFILIIISLLLLFLTFHLVVINIPH